MPNENIKELATQIASSLHVQTKLVLSTAHEFCRTTAGQLAICWARLVGPNQKAIGGCKASLHASTTGSVKLSSKVVVAPRGELEKSLPENCIDSPHQQPSMRL
jgi:hypothetical protein